jgi:phage tail-like protein
MTEFTVNPNRQNPYAGFAFQLVWDGRPVAGISEVSPLVRKTDVLVHRSGADPSLSHRSPGLTAYDPVVLSRGVTHDPEFENWASKCFLLGAPAGQQVSLADFRKDVILQLRNEAGQIVLAYDLFRCWVSAYVALPQLDAGTAQTAIQSITLENEGWIRDITVVEPSQPTVSAPAMPTKT